MASSTHRVQLLLVRHGQTSLNADGRLRGHLNPDLDPTGQDQVARLGAALAIPPTAELFTSPLMRAVQTAGAIGRPRALTPQIERALIDRDYGKWSGWRDADVNQQFGSLDAAPGVEPRSSVLDRALGFIHSLETHEGVIVCVSHDVVNRLVLSALAPRLDDPDTIPQPPACVNTLTRNSQGWSVESIAVTF